MFQHKGSLVAANLQHPAGACAAGHVTAKAGIEEACVMHAKFPDHRQIGCHFGGVVRRDGDGLAADEDVERAGVQNDAPVAGGHTLPELRRVVGADAVEVDDRGMRLGPPADEIAFGPA